MTEEKRVEIRKYLESQGFMINYTQLEDLCKIIDSSSNNNKQPEQGIVKIYGGKHCKCIQPSYELENKNLSMYKFIFENDSKILYGVLNTYKVGHRHIQFEQIFYNRFDFEFLKKYLMKEAAILAKCNKGIYVAYSDLERIEDDIIISGISIVHEFESSNVIEITTGGYIKEAICFVISKTINISPIDNLVGKTIKELYELNK